MKSVAQQEAVTAKVQAAFALYPTIYDVPAYDGDAGKATVRIENDEEAAYVEALYELFYQDSSLELLGRRSDTLIAG